MSTAADWFADEHEFRQLCGDAVSQAKGESAQEFAAEMVGHAKQYGLNCYLTSKQLGYLCKIADWTVPKRRPDEPSEPDGEAFRGGEAAAFEAEQQARIQRELK